MSTLLDEAEADRAVNKILNERKQLMEPVRLYKDRDGQIIQAVTFDLISRDDINAYIAAAQDELNKWQQALADYDALNSDQPILQTPVEAPPASEPAPQPEPAAPSPEPAPATPEVPQEQPVVVLQ